MILQTKIAISVFFLSLFRVILFIIKGLLPMAFFIHCMSSGVRPKHANYKPNGSYNVIYLLWSGAEIFQLGEYQRGGIQRNHSPLFTTQYTTQLRIWTNPLISHNALILQYFIPCFFVVFFSNITIYFTVSSCLPKQICRQLLELLYIVRSGVT